MSRVPDGAAPSSRKPPAPKGSPALIVILIAVLGPAIGLSQLAGAGGASIIGGFVALFSLLACMGTSLRPDLLRLSWIAPFIGFGAVVPRLLAEVSIPGAFALTTVLIFVAGLLPILGRAYSGVALGVGMGTLLGYALPIVGAVDSWQLVVAAIVGILLAFVLRLLLGLADPHGPIRKSIADLLDATAPDFAAAFEIWAADRPSRWTGRVLAAAARYQLSRRVFGQRTRTTQNLEADAFLAAAAARAEAIATAVRQKKAADALPPSDLVVPASLDPASRTAAVAMAQALSAAETARVERDESRVTVPGTFRSQLTRAAIRSSLRNGSVQVRHATRTAIAVLLALIVSAFLQPGDPLLPTLLSTTFAIVQTSWGATLTRARDRFIGLLVGGVLVVAVVLLLPPPALIVVSVLGLGVGMWFVTARPAIGTAGILVMSVGLNTELRNLEPLQLIAEYLILGAIALVIGGVVGFVVVPAWRPPALAQRVVRAVDATADTLAALGHAGQSTDASRRLGRLADALTAIQQLVPDHERLDDVQEGQLEKVKAGLQDLLTASLLFVSEPNNGSRQSTMDGARRALKDPELWRADSSDVADGLDVVVVVLAHQVAADRRDLDAAIAG